MQHSIAHRAMDVVCCDCGAIYIKSYRVSGLRYLHDELQLSVHVHRGTQNCDLLILHAYVLSATLIPLILFQNVAGSGQRVLLFSVLLFLLFLGLIVAQEQVEAVQITCLALSGITSLLMANNLTPKSGHPSLGVHNHQPRQQDLPFLGGRYTHGQSLFTFALFL